MKVEEHSGLQPLVQSSPVHNLDGLVADELRLVRECVEGGHSASWRALHRKYYPTVYAFLRRLRVGHEDIDDAVQEVFLSVFRALPDFRGEAELSTWLYRLCVTAASRGRRRHKALRMLRELLSKHKDSIASHEMAATEDMERRMVEQALDKLSPKDRVAFVLFELEDLSGKQIASILNCPESTVWRRLHYARRTVRSQLLQGAP